MTAPDPVTLLQWSRETLDTEGLPTTQRTRAAALLARQALEQAVIATNAGIHGAMRHVRGFHTQLLCLPAATDDTVATETSLAWATLSRTCHHHPYEMAPTVAEMQHLQATVERVLTQLIPR